MKIKLLVSLMIIAALFGCGKSGKVSYQGYIEGEPIFLASPDSGNLVEVHVVRGQQVKKGKLLFKLDDNPEILVVRENEAQLLQAQKIYKDLQNPRRTPEIAAINAQIEQAKAQLQLAQIKEERYRKLYEKHATDKETYDETVANLQEAKQLKAQYQSNMELAMQGSRDEQINAQQAQISALTARLDQSKWQLAQKIFYAPADGVIFDTYYHVGEFVNNRQPVASLLTPQNIRLEFFMPAEDIALIHLGQKIGFICDGCNNTNQAEISYISPTVEYVPPLVYSRENNDKLVFRIQAAINNSGNFKPGQPATITDISHE